MCHDDDSRAPAPPVRGEVAAHGGLTLTSADGTAFAAYEATPAGFRAGGAGMIVLPGGPVRSAHEPTVVRPVGPDIRPGSEPAPPPWAGGAGEERASGR